MVSNKSRSYPSLDAESEVKEAYGNQTLPVAVLPKDFDGIPLDGSQYLATVRSVSWILDLFDPIQIFDRGKRPTLDFARRSLTVPRLFRFFLFAERVRIYCRLTSMLPILTPRNHPMM